MCKRSTGRDAGDAQGGGCVFKLVQARLVLAVSAAASAAVLLAGAGPAGAAFPGENGQIAFVSDRDGDNEIFVMNADGSAQTQITTNVDGDFQPAWSPDGTEVAFTSDRTLPSFNLQVFVMNADGSSQTNLSQSVVDDGSAAWSPDGSKIAFRTFRDGSIEVFVMNADGSSQTNLTQSPSSDETPAWSPDGSKIAFISDRDGNFEVYVMNADGSGQTNLSQNPASDGTPAWSPDGSKIAFFSDRDGDAEIFVMNADGSAQTQLTANTAIDEGPAWSPDGTKIAFDSDRDGDSEIFVMDPDGSAQAQLTANTAGDSQPDWQTLAPPTIEVEIDIKPGSDVNPINLGSKGVIPVAILTTATFDALSVDPLSVAFGPAGAPALNGTGHAEDVDSDGDLDLVLQFRTQETGLASQDTEACLTGETFGGDPIEGCDAVTTK